MASVEIQTPDGIMRVQLDRDHLTIGRLAINHIALPYPHISRQHAELRLMGQTWWIVDLRSTNGLHVGGQRVGESRLAPGVGVMLSPLITLSLLAESAPDFSRPPVSAPGFSAPFSAPSQASGYSAPSQAPSYPQSYAQPYSQPRQAPGPYTMPAGAAREPITPLSELRPRTPYSDDEAPFYPQMRQPSALGYPAQPGYPQAAPGGYAPRPAQPAPRPAAEQAYAPPPALDALQQQAAAAQRRTAGAAPSPLLHVCQTCGQRTPPDAVYCQNCHHSIASECMRCRLSLLPVQDLCPRCQTPNPASVRRPRPTTTPW